MDRCDAYSTGVVPIVGFVLVGLFFFSSLFLHMGMSELDGWNGLDICSCRASVQAGHVFVARRLGWSNALSTAWVFWCTDGPRKRAGMCSAASEIVVRRCVLCAAS